MADEQEKVIGEDPQQVYSPPTGRMNFTKDEANEFAKMFIAAVKKTKGSLLKPAASGEFLKIAQERYVRAILNGDPKEAEIAISDMIPPMFALWLRTRKHDTNS